MIDKRLMVPTFFSPKEVYFGKGASMVIKYIQNSEVLVVSSNTVRNTEQYRKFMGYLEGKKSHEEVVKEATEETAIDIANRYSDSPVEVIIALGGGKVLDTAKVLRFLMDNPTKTLNDLAGAFTFPDLRRKMVLIPTTPATGSEANMNAVITRSGVKTPYTNKGFLPDMAILDNSFLQTISPQAMTPFEGDIFAHGFEAYFSKMANHFTRGHVKASLDLLQEAISDLKKNPGDVKALEKLQVSGFMGGLAAGNAYVGACHALAHAAESLKKASHGSLVLALTRPYLEWHREKTKNEEYGRFIELFERTGLDAYVDNSVLKNLDDNSWAERAMNDASIKTSPVRMTKELVIELIQYVHKLRG